MSTAALPAAFRRIDLTLAREPGHPAGDPEHGFRLVAPLDSSDRLDEALWSANRQACRVVRVHGDEDHDIGHLVRGPGGAWAFRYDLTGEDEDRVRRLDHVRLAPGEYVTVVEDDGEHTFRVIAVTPL